MNPYEFYLRAQPKKTVPAVIPKKAQEPRVKGVCRYCGQKIGRGVYFHEKACKERQL